MATKKLSKTRQQLTDLEMTHGVWKAVQWTGAAPRTMSDLLTQLLVAFNVIGVVGGVVYFVAKMGSKIDTLAEAIKGLTAVQSESHDDHESRIRALERARGVS